MISYHPTPSNPDKPGLFAKGYKVAHVSELNRIAICMTKYVWSPIIFEDGHRHQDNFISCDWCVLDFDGEMPLDEAKRVFCDMIHIIGTTKRHQLIKGAAGPMDRFRVVLKFSERITDLRLYRYNMHLLMRRFAADDSCKDGARYFFPCKEIVSIASEGFEEEVEPSVPKLFEPPIKPYSTSYAQFGLMPKWIEIKLSEIIPIGKRNNWVYSVARSLAECGYNYDQVLGMITSSATYSGQSITPNTMKMIRQHSASGFKRGVKNNPPE